jgi:ribonuclease G
VSELLIEASPGEVWAALIEAERLVELRIARIGTARVGEFFLGRVVEIKAGLGAALVDIGLSRAAFLSAEDAGKPGLGALTEGQSLVVQVTKEARADKAVGVTARPRLRGRFLDLLPGRAGHSVRAIHAAATPSSDERAEDEAALHARWQAIEAAREKQTPPAPLEAPEPLVAEILAAFAAPELSRIVIDDRAVFAQARGWLIRDHPALAAALVFHPGPTPLFESEGVAAEIDDALAARVAFPGGALIFAATNAAVMIDVDGAGPALAVNLAASREVARQIRLRNLAGPIVIDFIAMRARRERDEVSAAFAAALIDDPAAPQLLGWTRLGHMELMRKRRHPALDEILFETQGARAKTALTVALEALRAAERAGRLPGAIAIALHPEIAAALREGPAAPARAAFEAGLGRPLALQPDPARPRESFDIRRG